MIEEIQILKKHTVMVPFTWQNVPMFSVIAGINGSGKTKLLELINDASSAKNYQSEITRLNVKTPIKDKVRYVKAYNSPETLDSNVGTIQHVENRMTQLIEYFQKPIEQRNQPDWDKLIDLIEKRKGKSIQDIIPQEIVEAIPADYVCYLDNGFNNQYIAELFKAYQEKMDQIKIDTYDLTRLSEDEIYKKIGFPPPWKLINEIFNKYGFDYHIEEPIKGAHYQPTFRDKSENSNHSITFNDLSFGEKIIISLLLWSYNKQLNEKNSVFLLDEFDAHLNPSMSKMFIEIVKDKLVNEFNIQIIMTTHCPSTVAHVEDEDLFWMERYKPIRASTKKEIIPILSDGIMTYDEAGRLLTSIAQSAEKVLLFVEGETDEIHLRIAADKLSREESFDIFPCQGSDKLKQFLIGWPKGLFSGKTIIGIFDYDNGWKKISKNFKKIDEDIYQSKSCQNIFAITLPVPHSDFKKYEYCPIEFLYPKPVLDDKEMLKKRPLKEIIIFQEKIQFSDNDYAFQNDLWFYKICESEITKKQFADHAKTLDKTHFCNFTKLFDVIEQVQKN